MNEQYKIGTEVCTHTHSLIQNGIESFDKTSENRRVSCRKTEGDKKWAQRKSARPKQNKAQKMTKNSNA